MKRAELDEYCCALDVAWPATLAQIKIAYREQVSVSRSDRFEQQEEGPIQDRKLVQVLT